MIPFLALFRSVQAGSLLPLWSWHIDPVRSSTIMMSRGCVPHGEQAVERTWMLKLWMPRTREKRVLVVARSSTTTAFTGSHPGTEARHFVVIVSVTLPMSPLKFFAARAAAELLRNGDRGVAVGQVLRAGERGGVRLRLQRALRVVGVADVDHETRDRQ